MKGNFRLQFLVISVLTTILLMISGCSSVEKLEKSVAEVDQEVLTTELAYVQSNSTKNEKKCDAFEIYDEETDTCYIPDKCSTLAECEAIGNDMAQEIIDRYGNLMTDYEFSGEGGFYKEQLLAKYELDEESLINPQMLVVDNDLLPYRDDIETHVLIWDMFSYMIPANEREMLSKFYVFTDGNEGTLAQVEPDDDDVNKWWLSVDSMDARESFILQTTLLHEYAHLLTLQASQLDMDENVLFTYDDDINPNIEAAANCPNYFVDGMGCTKEGSYLNQYYNTFWTGMIDDWAERGVAEDEEQAAAFYEDYEDAFVTDYSVTSPQEDISEVWTYFILTPRYEAEAIWEEKIFFFYEYPEQVALRAEILSRLLSYLSQHEELAEVE